MEKILNNKKGFIGGLGVMLVVMLLGVVMVNSASANDTQDYESLITMEKLDLMLQSYFNNLNTTEIYNTYNDYITNKYYNVTNITNIYNEYYYYNQTFLNQTFNDFITNEYYEDNYYNTYNTYNQTFLNQTFIDNDYYETNYNYNETAFENMLSSINDIWDYLNSQKNEKINLNNLNSSIIDLSGSDCDHITFLFKDSNILSIYDTLGLGISTQLAQVNNINFSASVFVDTSNNVIENNINTCYEKINNAKHSFETDYHNDLEITINSNQSLSDTEVLLNMAFQDLWTYSHEKIFIVKKNNTPMVELYLSNYELHLKNLITGNEVYTDVNNLNTNDNTFNIYKLYFDDLNNEITLEIDNNLILTLNENPFDSSESEIQFDFSDRGSNNNVYVRSLYLNSDRIEFISSKYVVDSEEYEFNNNNWNNGEIYIMGDSVLYNINNNVITKDYNDLLNQTSDNYHIVFNLNETSISNLYCRN